MFHAIFKRVLNYQTIRLLRNTQNQWFKTNRARLFYYSITGGGTSFAISFFGAAKPANSPTTDAKKKSEFDLMREADLLYDSYLIDNAYGVLRRFRNSENPEMLWRLARVLCEKGKQCQNLIEKKRLFDEALEIADKAIKNEYYWGPETGNFGAHKWYAIILNYAAEMEGTKAQIQKSNDVKIHLERALEINPLDATTWHILGVWHFTFADLPTYSRLAAKAIYGSPPSSTYDEALRHFEKAEAIHPNFYSANLLYMGQVYERMGKKNEAIEYLKKAFFSPIVTIDDVETHKKALELLTKKFGIKQQALVNEQQQQRQQQ